MESASALLTDVTGWSRIDAVVLAVGAVGLAWWLAKLRPDPLQDLSLLIDPAKVQLVMKEGVIHKDCATPVPSRAALHLAGGDTPLQEQGVREALAEMH